MNYAVWLARELWVTLALPRTVRRVAKTASVEFLAAPWKAGEIFNPCVVRARFDGEAVITIVGTPWQVYQALRAFTGSRTAWAGPVDLNVTHESVIIDETGVLLEEKPEPAMRLRSRADFDYWMNDLRQTTEET